MSESPVKLRTEVFDALCKTKGHKTQAAVAQALRISDSQLQKVRAHTTKPGPKFILAALLHLGVTYDDLFTQAEQKAA